MQSGLLFQTETEQIIESFVKQYAGDKQSNE